MSKPLLSGFSFLVFCSLLSIPGIGNTKENTLNLLHYPLERVTLSKVVNQQSAIQASVTSNNCSCFGFSNGSIYITGVTGGSGEFQYSTNNGNTWNSSPTFTNLSAGMYSVLVRDYSDPANVTILNSALIISQPAQLQASVYSENVTECFGNTNGSITISGGSGGSGSYQFSQDGGVTWSIGNYPHLSAGSYTIKMRDALNTSCMVTLNSSLILTQPQQLSANITVKDPTCNNVSDGEIEIINKKGGSGTYELTVDGGKTWVNATTGYSPDGGKTWLNKDFIFNDIHAGIYQLGIRDAQNPNCQVSLSENLVVEDSFHYTASTVMGNVFPCINNNNGTINIQSPQGGSGHYQFSIDSGDTWSYDPKFENLPVGSYAVQLKDTERPQCVTSLLTDSIRAPYTIKIDSLFITPACAERPSGAITVFASGGMSDLTYQWTGEDGTFSTNNSLKNVNGGNYQLKIDGELGCHFEQFYEVPEIPAITVLEDGIKLITSDADVYSWVFNGKEISGASAQTYTALQSGIYTVYAVNEGCLSADTIHFSGVKLDENAHSLSVPAITNATYEWYHEGNFLDTVSGNTFHPTLRGNYTVKITFDEANLRVSKMVTAVYEYRYDPVITGVITSANTVALDIVPNPNNGEFNILSDKSLSGSTYTIIHQMGVPVKTEVINSPTNLYPVHLKEIARGIYIIKIESNNVSLVKAISIE